MESLNIERESFNMTRINMKRNGNLLLSHKENTELFYQSDKAIEPIKLTVRYDHNSTENRLRTSVHRLDLLASSIASHVSEVALVAVLAVNLTVLVPYNSAYDVCDD